MMNKICDLFKKDDTQSMNRNEIIPTQDANSGTNTLGNEVIEFSLRHFPYPLVNFHSDTLDYFLSEEQLDDLYDDQTDFKNYSDFEKWIPIIFGLGDLNSHDFTNKTHPYTIACKNCLKYLIISNSFIDYDIYTRHRWYV